MTRPVENCAQPETEIRERAYTDRQLLELAAKAAGLRIDKSPYNGGGAGNTGFDVCGNAVLDWHNGKTWNPLTSDGDALRLAVKLQLLVDVADHNHETVVIWADGPFDGVREPHETDPYAATRRAIVRAAAAIAEGAKS
jgi:hypothetical protein